MKRKLLNITSIEESGNIYIENDNDIYVDNYYLDELSLYDGKKYIDFVESCKKIIRKSQLYNAYISYLKELGLNKDAFQPNIDDQSATIEMHHGPIFTLEDYVKITIDHFLDNKILMSSFTIAKQVMNDHIENLVQVVMLCKTNHKLADAGKLYISQSQTWGDILSYIKKYYKYIISSPTLRMKITKYIENAKNMNDINSILRIDEIVSLSKKTTGN